MVSSSAPHRGQPRSVLQRRSANLPQTGVQSDNACHIKCLIFLEVLSDQTLAFKGVVLGSVTRELSSDGSRDIARAYPDFTEYEPDFVWIQQKLSGR